MTDDVSRGHVDAFWMFACCQELYPLQALQVVGSKPRIFELPLTKARNRVRVEAERLPAQQLANFQSQVRNRFKYALASNLWASGGMLWEDALELATEAFLKVPLR